MPDQDINNLIKQWLTASNESNTKNILAEKIGEYYAKIKVNKLYPQNKGFITIPTRGSKGAPVLDIVYELENGEILIVESKFNTSQLGKVNREIFAASESGEIAPLTLKAAGRQLDEYWLQDRIREIRKTNKRLANKLSRAWTDGKLKVLKLQTILNVESGEFVVKVTDVTSDLDDFKRGRNRKLGDKALTSGRLVRTEKLTNPDFTKAERRAKDFRSTANQTEEKSKKASEKVKNALEKANSAKGKVATEKYQKIVVTLELEAKEAHAIAMKSSEAALKAEAALEDEMKLLGSAEKTLKAEVKLGAELVLDQTQNLATKATRLIADQGARSDR